MPEPVPRSVPQHLVLWEWSRSCAFSCSTNTATSIITARALSHFAVLLPFLELWQCRKGGFYLSVNRFICLRHLFVCLLLFRLCFTLPGSIRNAEDCPWSLVNSLQCTYVRSIPRFMPIYTDRSTPGYSLSFEVHTPPFHVPPKLKVNHLTSSPAAELPDIQDAFSCVLEHPPQAWANFADSVPALQALSKPQSRSITSQLVLDALLGHHTPFQRGNNTVLQWIPGHSGISGYVVSNLAARCAHNSPYLSLLPHCKIRCCRSRTPHYTIIGSSRKLLQRFNLEFLAAFLDK